MVFSRADLAMGRAPIAPPVVRPGFAEVLRQTQQAQSDREKLARSIPDLIQASTMEATRVVSEQRKKEAMGFLGIDLKKIVSGIAPAIVSATVHGGSTASQNALKSVISSAAAKPVFDKFGSDFEKGVKATAAITATAATAGLFGAGAAAGAGSAGLKKSLTSFLPATGGKIDFGGLITKGFDFLKDTISKSAKQPGQETTTGVQSSGGTSPIVWVLVAVVGLLLFGKKLFR